MAPANTNVIRTPDARFENLPDWPYTPHYQEVAPGIEMHYVDEGPRDGKVVLLLHGQPSWGYLYRKMIPPLVDAGYRVIVPDLIGFGRSDKPTSKDAFSYAGQVAWMRAFVERMNLTGINVFLQDWGGLIGLRVISEVPERFASITAGNTGLPAAPFPMSVIGRWVMRYKAWRKGDTVRSMEEIGMGGTIGPQDAFANWIAHARYAREFNPAITIQSGTVNDLSTDEVAAYAAPFPDEPYMAGPRSMPWMVPSELAQGHAAWKKLEKLDTPVLLVFSDSDPVTAGRDKEFARRFKGAKGQPHKTIEGAGHFLQDDKGEEIAAHMIGWMKSL